MKEKKLKKFPIGLETMKRYIKFEYKTSCGRKIRWEPYKTDICQTCANLKNAIKELKAKGKKVQEKEKENELKIHHITAIHSYYLKKSFKNSKNTDTIIITIDYAAKHYFPACKHHTNKVDCTDNTFFYGIWTELTTGTSSNESQHLIVNKF